ncbi:MULTISPECIES: hypothetical protein [Nostocaceae]|nr:MULTISPECIES: hypothetical protein [Nostocaceae]
MGIDPQILAQRLKPAMQNTAYEVVQEQLRQGGAIKRGDRYGR